MTDVMADTFAGLRGKKDERGRSTARRALSLTTGQNRDGEQQLEMVWVPSKDRVACTNMTVSQQSWLKVHKYLSSNVQE